MTTKIDASTTSGLITSPDNSGILELQSGGVTVATLDSGGLEVNSGGINVSSGGVLISNQSALGYSAGAGGTVTQLTSKATTVTLNAPTGRIVMNNASLEANASVQFSLSNTSIAATDLVLVTVNFSSQYAVRVVATATNSAAILLTNTTTGSLSDAVVLNFAIIKGATS
jgi:hypothetical protein